MTNNVFVTKFRQIFLYRWNHSFIIKQICHSRYLINMRLIRLPLEDMYLSNQLIMCKKILRKFEPAFRAIAKKIEPRVNKWFSYIKKTCMSKTVYTVLIATRK